MNPPKPTALKMIQGTVQPSRMNPNEPKPRVGAVKPEGMHKAASDEWDRLAPMLERLGLLRETDALALELLCESYAAWRVNRRKADFRSGVAAARDREFLLKCLSQFGMSPSAATRVAATPSTEADPLEMWMAAKASREASR